MRLRVLLQFCLNVSTAVYNIIIIYGEIGDEYQIFSILKVFILLVYYILFSNMLHVAGSPRLSPQCSKSCTFIRCVTIYLI